MREAPATVSTACWTPARRVCVQSQSPCPSASSRMAATTFGDHNLTKADGTKTAEEPTPWRSSRRMEKFRTLPDWRCLRTGDARRARDRRRHQHLRQTAEVWLPGSADYRNRQITNRKRPRKATVSAYNYPRDRGHAIAAMMADVAMPVCIVAPNASGRIIDEGLSCDDLQAYIPTVVGTQLTAAVLVSG